MLFDKSLEPLLIGWMLARQGLLLFRGGRGGRLSDADPVGLLLPRGGEGVFAYRSLILKEFDVLLQEVVRVV